MMHPIEMLIMGIVSVGINLDSGEGKLTQSILGGGGGGGKGNSVPPLYETLNAPRTNNV